MHKSLTGDMLDAKTPQDVNVQTAARKPVTDPTLGIPVTVNRTGTPRHRLVSLGDSLTHGFQSGAIFNTQLAYPALIARELGWYDQMRFSTYGGPGDGLPLNLENLARSLETRFGTNITWYRYPPLLTFLRDYLDKIEDYWERGEGSRLPTSSQINHNLAVYGWDLRNTLSRNADICQATLTQNPSRDNLLRQIVEHHNERAALEVLNTARDAAGNALSPIQAAAALGAEGSQENGEGDGIETLTILIGSNNALGSILTFRVSWTDVGYDDMEVNDQYTVWRPIHFQAELDKLVAEVKKIRARHVIFGTVPHVTIVPFARGVETKLREGSRYFPYYTLPWISDRDFNPQRHPHLTGQEARAIDSAIDQYNDFITDAVRQARLEGKDWYVFEISGLLDRLASRRYIEDPMARPEWWDEVGGKYELPPQLQALSPTPDSRYFTSNEQGRLTGGLFSLDGVHPTTIGYGIMAQEIINIMQLAGIKFYQPDGVTERTGEIKIDFDRLIALDTLISQPPSFVTSILEQVGWVDANFRVFSSMMMASY